MEKATNKTWIFVLLIALGLLYFKYDRLKDENIELQGEVESYQDALSEANDNIEQANSNIEEAQSYAWESYDDMGYILESLETVDTVDP